MNRRLVGRSSLIFNPFSIPGLLFTQPTGDPGGGDPKTDPKEEPKGEPKGDPKEKTLTQSEVNVIAAREKAEGKRAAEASIAESLGVTIEEAKTILAKHKETEDAKKTEADKAKEAADREKASATTEKSAAAKEIHETRLERAFRKEGLDLDSSDDKTKRVLRMVTVEPGASYEDVLKDVQSVKADFPALFDEQDPKDPKRRAPSSDPKGKPPKQTGTEDSFARGAERAKSHRGAYTAVVHDKQKT
jgi:hypothetical protein